jgi:hypothetical protein
MLAFLQLLGTFVAKLFRSRRRLEVENLFLRHQLSIALRGAPHRRRLRGSDRALLVWMTWLWPSLLDLSRVVQPDTILRWHRAGFRAFWRWKSRGRPGRPRVSCELRELIQRMSKENSLWGAPRIHGDLIKLGFEIAESTGLQIHDPAPRTAIADLADIPAQPCGLHRSDRSLRGSNLNVRVPVCVSRVGPRSTTAALVRGDPSPDRRVARTTDRGGIPVGHGTDLFGARQ